MYTISIYVDFISCVKWNTLLIWPGIIKRNRETFFLWNIVS